MTTLFTKQAGREANQGYDGFVPLIDSGIYVAIWCRQKFLSAILYSCSNFDDNKAVRLTRNFFKITHVEHKQF